MREIARGIIQIGPSEEPLSADVILVRGESRDWVFDVGAGEEALETLKSLERPWRAVLSHFHPDHIGNLSRLEPEEIYQGRFTWKKTGRGVVVSQPLSFEDGRTIRILPFPSSHAKDSMAMEVDGTYLFTGDGTDCTVKAGRAVFNTGMLQQTIRTIRESPARWIGLSHETPFLRPKQEVLERLEEIYRKRDPQESYICVDDII